MNATAIAILVAAVMGFAAGWHFGREGLQLSDAKQVVKAEVAQDTKRSTDTKTVAEEAKTYEAATDPLAPISAPVVSVCYYAPAVPAARAPGSGPHEAPPARDPSGGDPHLPTLVKWDTGPLVRAAHNADAQIAGLQDYILKVCQAKLQ